MPTPLVFSIGQTNRAMPGQKVSGDGLLVVEEPDFTLFAVIDGLGHGEAAARATTVCLAVFKAGPRLALADLLTKAHAQLRGERGVVAGLLRIKRLEATFEAAIVGNVSITHQRHVPGMPAKRVHVLGQPGVLGTTLRRIIVQPGEVCEGDVFVLHTDGIQSRAEFGPMAGLAADEAAERIVSEFGKATGTYVLVNTSFNTHEEPINGHLEDSVRALLNDAVDVLATPCGFLRVGAH